MRSHSSDPTMSITNGGGAGGATSTTTSSSSSSLEDDVLSVDRRLTALMVMPTTDSNYLPTFVLPTVEPSSSTHHHHQTTTTGDHRYYAVEELLKAGLDYESNLGLLLTRGGGVEDGLQNTRSSGILGADIATTTAKMAAAAAARSSPTSAIETVFFHKEIASHSKNDWKMATAKTTTTLPPLRDFSSLVNDKSTSLRLSKAAQAWIQIIQRMTSNDEPSSSSSPSTSTLDRELHNAVYQRLAHLLVGLVGTGTAHHHQEEVEEEGVATRTSDGTSGQLTTATITAVGDCGGREWIYLSRSLAQQLLKQSRMKRHGAMDVYAWFTLFAAECSELLGDVHLAHLAYKSVDTIVRRHQQGASAGGGTGSGVAGSSTISSTRGINSSTNTNPRLMDGNMRLVGDDDVVNGPAPKNYVVPPTPATSPGVLRHKTIRGNPTVDSVVGNGRMVPIMAAMTADATDTSGGTATAPASLTLHPRRMNRSGDSSLVPWSAYSNFHPDSKVGSHLVPPGTLEERILRTSAATVQL
jgi:hypothetical protein